MNAKHDSYEWKKNTLHVIYNTGIINAEEVELSEAGTTLD